MRGVAMLAAILAALLSGSAAHGHASLIRSEPADRAVVAQPPARLTLTFNEPVSPVVLRLVRPDGETAELSGVAADGATLAVALPAGLARGTHLLSWRVISADGHPVGGALTFSVGEPSATPAPTVGAADLRLRGAVWLAKFVLYLGLLVGVGGVFYGRWIASARAIGPVGTTITLALQSGLVAAVMSVGLQGVDVFGATPAELREPLVWLGGFTTSYGLTLALAAVALGFGLAAHSSRRPTARSYATVALIGVGLALAASGHAATAGPAWVTRPAVFLHAISVAFWVGALLPLAAALRASNGRAELMRFSKIIPLPLVVLIASGFVLATVQLRQIDTLWTTSYGVVLSAKLAAVAVLLALAAMNRWLTPQVSAGDRRAAQRLVRSIPAELVIVAAILGLVASWRFTPPPRSLLAAASQPIHVHIHAEKAMADLHIEPAGPTGRRIIVGLLDGEFRPLSAKEVVLVLAKPHAGIEPLRLPATYVAETTWRVDGVRLPLAGRWQVRVEILVSDFEKLAVEDEIELPR
jgi:copper transport protein